MSPHQLRKKEAVIVSPGVLERVVGNYLLQLPEDDLRVKVIRHVVYKSKIPAILDNNKLRWTYDLDRGAMHIRTPAALCNAFSYYMADLLDDCYFNGIFTREEKKLIKLMQVSHIIFPAQISRGLLGTLSNQSLSKKEAWFKIPDGMVERFDPSSCQYIPVIAVEVGFSQQYNDLLLDMEQWLCKSNTVNTVILVDIKELEKPRPWKFEGEAHERIKLLLGKYGNAKGKEMNNVDDIPDKEDDDDEGDQSSPDMYDSIRREVRKHTDDWVGELKVTVEVWERGVKLRGKLVRIKSHLTYGRA